ncbi:B-cell receptor-associated protein 31 [Halotydeus destructor]|nr:B-cell receptor-associated protein 31 [Halotydeus destructor]
MMSLQWALVAGFLYVEIAFIVLLLLPIISPKTWQRFFKSKFLQSLEGQANLYFTGFLIILILMFVDSIREMRKHSSGREHEIEHGHLDSELQHSMKLFRAQRNFYIAGFALFLCLVVRRLVILISTQAQLMAQSEAAFRQAKSASDAAERLMKGDSTSTEKEVKPAPKPSKDELAAIREKHEQEVKTLKNELSESREELIKLRLNCDTVKKQAASVSTEYDRLMKEHEKLQHEAAAVADSRKDR